MLAAVWVADEAYSACHVCNKPFTQVNRRHHCRSCGHLVDDACSQSRALPKPLIGKPIDLVQAELGQPQRVCDRCVSADALDAGDRALAAGSTPRGEISTFAQEGLTRLVEAGIDLRSPEEDGEVVRGDDVEHVQASQNVWVRVAQIVDRHVAKVVARTLALRAHDFSRAQVLQALREILVPRLLAEIAPSLRESERTRVLEATGASNGGSRQRRRSLSSLTVEKGFSARLLTARVVELHPQQVEVHRDAVSLLLASCRMLVDVFLSAGHRACAERLGERGVVLLADMAKGTQDSLSLRQWLSNLDMLAPFPPSRNDEVLAALTADVDMNQFLHQHGAAPPATPESARRHSRQLSLEEIDPEFVAFDQSRNSLFSELFEGTFADDIHALPKRLTRVCPRSYICELACRRGLSNSWAPSPSEHRPYQGSAYADAVQYAKLWMTLTCGLTNPGMPTRLRWVPRTALSSRATTAPREPVDVPLKRAAGYGIEVAVLTEQRSSLGVPLLEWVMETELLHDARLLERIDECGFVLVHGVKLLHYDTPGVDGNTDRGYESVIIARPSRSCFLPSQWVSVGAHNTRCNVLIATRILPSELSFALGSPDGGSNLLSMLDVEGNGQVSSWSRSCVQLPTKRRGPAPPPIPGDELKLSPLVRMVLTKDDSELSEFERELQATTLASTDFLGLLRACLRNGLFNKAERLVEAARQEFQGCAPPKAMIWGPALHRHALLQCVKQCSLIQDKSPASIVSSRPLRMLELLLETNIPQLMWFSDARVSMCTVAFGAAIQHHLPDVVGAFITMCEFDVRHEDDAQEREASDAPVIQLNVLDASGESPLLQACLDPTYVDEHLVQVLVDQGADPTLASHGGVTALHHLMRTTVGLSKSQAAARLSAARTLVKAGADPQARDLALATPLHVAASSGFVEGVELLVTELGVEADGYAVLMALDKRSDAAAMALLEHGADPAYKNKDLSLLHYAVMYDCPRTLDWLLEHVDLSEQLYARPAPLLLGAKHGSVEACRHLLDQPSGPTALLALDEATEESVLHAVARSKSGELAGMLVQHMPSVEVARQMLRSCSKKGYTPMHVAAASNAGDVLSVFLAVGAVDPEMRGEGRGAFHTPLMLTAFFGHTRAASVLLQMRANPECQAENGGTPLIVACQRQVAAAYVRLLLEHGANPNRKDSSGNTPLHYAVKGGKLEIVRLLLSHGALATSVNGKGKVPKDLTRSRELRAMLG